MAEQFPSIDNRLQAFIEAQPIFFVGTAAQDGRVNVSPKGMDSLRVLGPNRLVWRNVTGSGNETAGHLLQVNRMTLMWCSFTLKPMILRAYGSARTIHPRDADWNDLNALFPAVEGARQIYDMSVEMAQTSCGYAVPFLDNPRPRDTLAKWTADRGEDGIHSFWADRNQTTIDGLPTGILTPE
ncbi:MAG: pyridoxamine 5'-phosphate oxidase family protein [Rhodobacter sp.]|nr:pyridoxamine 5'-phosphate oxidase family protein [Rhodobacter sp.]